MTQYGHDHLPPGQVLEMPVLARAGGDHPYLVDQPRRPGGRTERAESLRIYWDGGKEPAVEVPLGEFFAVGQGSRPSVESVPVQVSPTGALVLLADAFRPIRQDRYRQ